MRAKLQEISTRLSDLGITHQQKLPFEDELLQSMDYIDHLTHEVYKAIEAQYANFNPEASAYEQQLFYTKIIELKNVLRSIQVIHTDLAKRLYDKSELYIHNEEDISLNDKYILPDLQGKKPKEIVKANFYRLLDNIKKNNALDEEQFAFINSLFMQIASRPEGIKLIVKLNYLLETKNANLVLKSSKNFDCSMSAKGFGKTSPESPRKSFSDRDLRSSWKNGIVPGEGVDQVRVGIDFQYNDKPSALSLEVYASPGHGLTDIGPPFILFAHELIHGIHNLSGKALHNFGPFFQSPGYREDQLMKSLYPTTSLYSYGPAAEEYRTIEGGKLSENSLRKEHGFNNRTGHISSEPGSRAVRDLYFIGLARSYEQSDLDALQTYTDAALHEEDCTDVDQFIDHYLQIEKYKSFNYSLKDLIRLSKDLSSYQLKQLGHAITEYNNSSDIPEDQDLAVRAFLMLSPPKVAQFLVGVLKANEKVLEEEVDFEALIEIIPHIKKLSDMLQDSGLPTPLQNAVKGFTEYLESRAMNIKLDI